MAIVIIRTLLLYFSVVLAMRLMGKRQLGELELPELVTAVLIADLGAHPLQDIGIPMLNGLVPIIVLFCCEILLSGLAMRSPRTRSVLFGTPCFLVEHGKINQREMRRSRFTLDELTEELRSKGYMDISQIEYAILETGGVLNAIPFAEYRTATAHDLGIVPEDCGYPTLIINDGRLLAQNLRAMGRDRRWLANELKKRGVSAAGEVYIMTLDRAGRIYFAKKEREA